LNIFNEYLIQHSLKLEGTKDNFRRVKVPGTLIERPRLYGSILSPLIPLCLHYNGESYKKKCYTLYFIFQITRKLEEALGKVDNS
jgi:hypothetical protein